MADHTVAECEHMADFYLREFSVRLPKQLIHFDPFAKDTPPTTPLSALPQPHSVRGRPAYFLSISAAGFMFVIGLLSPLGHLWNEKSAKRFSRYAVDGAAPDPVSIAEDIAYAFEPLLCVQVLMVLIAYFVVKLVIRNVSLTETDKKGWGRETYWAAMFHNIGQGIVWLGAIVSLAAQSSSSEDFFTRVSEWFETPWQGWDRMFWERLGFAMNIVEMFTDSVLYSGYPGFGEAYWRHHMMTFMAATGFFVVQRAPVGLAVSFGSLMELGSAPLNYCNLWPSRSAFRFRTACYSVSRLVATAVLCYGTHMAIYRPSRFAWVPLLPLWAVMIVNFQWLFSMLKAQYDFEQNGTGRLNQLETAFKT